MQSPPRMLHSTSSTDKQRYSPKPTAARGSGLQHDTSASHSGSSHPERLAYLLAVPPALGPRRTPFSSASGGPANAGFPLAATVLTAPLPLGPRDSPVMTTKDSRSYLTRIYPEPPAPSSSQPRCIAWTRTTSTAFPSELYPSPPTLGHRTPRVFSPNSFNSHPRRPSQSFGDTISRPPLRSRGSSRLFFRSASCTLPSPRDSPRDSRN